MKRSILLLCVSALALMSACSRQQSTSPGGAANSPPNDQSMPSQTQPPNDQQTPPGSTNSTQQPSDQNQGNAPPANQSNPSGSANPPSDTSGNQPPKQP